MAFKKASQDDRAYVAGQLRQLRNFSRYLENEIRDVSRANKNALNSKAREVLNKALLNLIDVSRELDEAWAWQDSTSKPNEPA